ncbi:AAA family ATPase [Alkalinema pantanalense CENA528]|uniref:AAA family ATPase n=1 Tax=Alkalinema pantanalense TaxID=1620705 RepID=UPI003D6FEF87
MVIPIESTRIISPISNPYIVGPPVTGSLFVGREDILKTLEELWLKPGQVESVVIYGHRRMGKTSILRNLPGRFGTHTHIINFNIQTLGTLPSTQELIFALAQTLYDDLPAPLQTAIPEPQLTDFPTPEKDFRRWLKKLEPYRQNHRFIIAIDEFELIETGIHEQRFDASLIGHWRGILMDFPWIIFAFAGLHTLQEMTQNYWNPLFGSVRKIPVSFLSPAATSKLITNPNDDFPIDYDRDALFGIYNLTGGQPYLIQLICQNLVSRFNQLRFEQNQEIEPLFTDDDVAAIVNHPRFFQEGSAYFRAIWDQAQETNAETQLAILRHLTHDPATASQLQTALNLQPDDLAIGLQLLLDHDIIQLNPDDRYEYRVELMRTWVARTQMA